MKSSVGFWLVPVAVLLAGCSSMFVADGNQRKDQVGKTVIGQSFARAKDEKCMSNLRQVRQGIQVQMTSDETPPADLTALRFPAELSECPIDKRPYNYDPAAGTVQCKHLGHEKY